MTRLLNVQILILRRSSNCHRWIPWLTGHSPVLKSTHVSWHLSAAKRYSRAHVCQCAHQWLQTKVSLCILSFWKCRTHNPRPMNLFDEPFIVGQNNGSGRSYNVPMFFVCFVSSWLCHWFNRLFRCHSKEWIVFIFNYCIYMFNDHTLMHTL